MSSTQTHDDCTLQVTTGHSPRGIGDLPPELLLKIADLAAVTDANSKKVLCKLCLVKPLNPAATEALYSNIHAGTDFNPVLLVRTLLSHSSLAALVRSLKLNAVWNEYRNQRYRIAILNSDAPNTPPVTLEDLQGLTTDPVVKRLLQAPDVHFGAAACALLYLHTPNIHTLKYAVEGHYRKLKLPELSIMVSTRPWEIPFLPSPLLKTPPNYNLLKNVTIRTPHIDIDRIAKLLQLPNLYQLEVWNLRELQPHQSWHWDANLFPDHTSTVRHLTLRSGYLHADVLSLVIRCCKSLSHFAYHMARNHNHRFQLWTKFDRPTTIHFGVVVDALRKHRETLRHLALYNMGAIDRRVAPTWIPASLADLHNLENLCIDASVVFPRSSWGRLKDVLPASLKRLHLLHTWYDLMTDCVFVSGALYKMYDRYLFPHLSFVEMEVSRDFWRWAEEVEKEDEGFVYGASAIKALRSKWVRAVYRTREDWENAWEVVGGWTGE